jgi:hypothetical protein
MTVPVTAGCPGIVPVEAVIIVTVVVPVAIIIIIQFGPALGIAYAHTRIAVGIIIFPALVTSVVLLFCLYIFVLRLGRGKIYIVRCLTGLISGSATAERGCCQCQK